MARHVETTHRVENQALPLPDHDAYAWDAPLREAVERAALELGGAWVVDEVRRYGQLVGRGELHDLAAQANAYPPELRTHDRYGHRIDEVTYHPAYHELMRRAMAHGVHSVAWVGPGPGGQVAHAALLYLHSGLEAGTACPLTMTHACVPALRVQPEVAAEWEPRVLGQTYDARCIPAADKHSATIGMAMTEKQGGSDVRANSTQARPLGEPGPGEAYALTGHKWFCSAPMSDAFLTLAQAPGGLSCFLVPRWLPDGSRNRFLIQRLKDKLGNRSNASSEIEYDRTWGRLVGEEGRGVATIIAMVAQTRVDCAAGSAGLMRAALVQAIHHARHRRAFGRPLVAQPLMLQVLADLALEAEAATALAMRVARSHEEAEREGRFARVATPIAKYWITHRAPGFAFEAMECLGGSGYVEECPLPRIYREVPVNSIWEGSGNVQCLDVLRAMRNEPDVVEALLDEIRLAQGGDRRFDTRLAQVTQHLHHEGGTQAGARRLVEDLAMLLSASLLLRHAPGFVADAYCASRLSDARGVAYGALPQDVDADALVRRALP